MSVFLLDPIIRDASQFLELFDRIPERILTVLAEADADKTALVLTEYVKALDGEVGQRAFSYAEIVAKKMKSIFNSDAASTEIRKLAIEAVLVAAERLNRFAAMDAFDSMLTSIEKDEDAFEVAEMLGRRMDEYERLAERVPSLKLHPAIRAIRDQAVKAK